MAGALQKNDLYKYLQQLERSYDKGTDEDVKQTLHGIFGLQKVDLFSLVLVIAREAKFIHNSGRKSIAEITLYAFRDWLDKKKHLVPNKNHKDDAMFYLVTFGIPYTEILADIYQLHKGNDRGFLVKHLEYLIDSKRDTKTAANVVIALKLQDFIEPEVLLLPLIVGDKFQVAEAVLENSKNLQVRYAIMLNKMCGMSEEALMDDIQSKRRLRIVDKTKFKGKTLQKISEKVVKKYDLNPEDFPSIFRKKNLNSLRYLLSCKYKGTSNESAKWDGLIEAAVANDVWLQEQLIFLITYQHHDLQTAAYWAQRLNTPEASLPARVKSEIENPMPSLQDMPRDTGRSFDDWDNEEGDFQDDGFMFASDDITYDETKETIDSLKELTVKEEYWNHPLSVGNIKFVNDCEELKHSIKVIFKGGNIIGFDGEWQPKYGKAGQKDRMAIMQLAVKEEVYIIDVMEFDKTAEGKELLEVLFTKLFTSEDTLRLGYGIDSDIKIITDNYPYAKDLLANTKHFEDLVYLSKQLLKIPCIIERLKIDKSGQDKERGLSQLVKQCLGKPLDKTYQVSNWEQRPLSSEQLRYAALDALCLIKIYDLFDDLAAEFKISVDMSAKSGDCQNAADFQTQVKEEPVVKGPPRRPGELAVVCDTMLQGLGRYLRCCGVDTVMLQNGEEHMKAVELYYKEKRVILTRGKPFYQLRACVPHEMCMGVPDGSIANQVSAVFQRYNIRVTSKDIFSRCQICNGNNYIKIKPEHMMLACCIKQGIRLNEKYMNDHHLHQLRGSRKNDTGIDFRNITIANGVSLKCEFVPISVFDRVETFFVCANCGKVFWDGSHFDKVADQFAHIIQDSDEDDVDSFYDCMDESQLEDT